MVQGLAACDEERLREVLSSLVRHLHDFACEVPTDGPVGRLRRAARRHPWRPAHPRFMIQAPSYQTPVTHLFREEARYLDGDGVSAMRSSPGDHFRLHAPGLVRSGTRQSRPF